MHTDKVSDLSIDTKWGKIKTTVPREQVGTLFIIVFLATLSLVGAFFDNNTAQFLSVMFIVITFTMVGIFILNYNSQDIVLESLKNTYSLELDFLSTRIWNKPNKNQELIMVKAVLKAYETCYFRSMYSNNLELATSIKGKIDEINQEIIKIENEYQ